MMVMSDGRVFTDYRGRCARADADSGGRDRTDHRGRGETSEAVRQRMVADAERLMLEARERAEQSASDAVGGRQRP